MPRRRAAAPDGSGTEPDSRDGAGYEPRAQDVARRLREAIYEGRLKPGQPVRQEAVAEELGVSRIPVREALRQLEAEGLVVLRPHSGARVATLDFAECEEIYKIRERLEPLALSESIVHITEEQAEQAAALALELQQTRNDPVAYLECDRRLHLACYAGVATPRLLRMIVGFWNTTQQYRRILLTTFGDEDFDVLDSEHLLIVNSLMTGNARMGEDLMRAHIERSRMRLAHHRELFGP
jgi:DNA-binding GntR family transcriptional regulator